MKKIDIHCHTSNRVIEDVVYSDASINAILKHMDEHEIEKTVLLATYFPHKGTGISNFRLLKWIDGHLDRLMMFGSLDFQHYFRQGYNELEEMAKAGDIAGIKIYTCYQDFQLEDSRFRKTMDLAQEYHLPVMFHAGYSYASMRKYGKMSIGPAQSAETLRPVAERWSGIDFIFSHMSKPFFHEMLFAAKELPNVYTDVSGLIDSKFDEKEIPIVVEEIKLFLRECGSRKLLFGTDFPVQTHDHSIRFVEEAMESLSEVDKERVYYSNAVDILCI